MMGHSLGAAGAIEAIICLLALQHQLLPPNINFRAPDEGVDLNVVANDARPMASAHCPLELVRIWWDERIDCDPKVRGMSLAIAGMGWVTPLGNGVDPVWKQLLQGYEATATKISEQFGDRSYNAFRVPESALTALAPHPRLRRASVISRFAAAAGLEALQTAGVKVDSQSAERIALVFAISNGGVIYTKRFYRDIVEAGAQSASPLLFPETVFNAPASHLAAILGITGTTYTLVGDSAVGLLAIKMADDLMANEALDYCLVVGAEEADWILCDAYRRWRLLRLTPPIEPFNEKKRGMILE